MGAVGAFDGAVEFGRARGQHEQVQAALLAGLFELGGELGAAIDLHRANGKGHAVLQGVEELGGGWGGGAGVGLDHIPARDHIAGGELFEDHARHRTHVQSIDFDQVAGLQKPHTAWVCAPHRDEAAAPGAIPEPPCAAARPAGLAV